MKKLEATAKTVMPPAAFAGLGEGKVAYLKPLRSEEVNGMFPQAPPMSPGVQLWALFSANGAPILIADSREAAEANAWQNDITTVSVH